jgi:energy-coupling factor transporter ATP-binding protein EcfA2
MTVRVITNSHNLNKEEKKIFENLYSTQSYSKDINKKTQLPDYKNFTHEDYLKELRIYFGIEDKYILDIPEGYVFTPDNYFKMVMINIKIMAGIPVILMGETGCGKTFLIRMMSQIYSKKKVKKGSKEEKVKKEILKIKNIHAGITEEDIIKFMKENVIEEAKKLDKLNKQQKELNEKIWVFFDEINTSTCMGIITEIMCNKTMRGEKLPESIIYFAACNPYKRKTEKALNTNFGLVFKKDFKNKDLVYNVLPLIHSLINFIYDFGYLQKEDEKRYIKSIIRQIGKNNDDNKNNENNKNNEGNEKNENKENNEKNENKENNEKNESNEKNENNENNEDEFDLPDMDNIKNLNEVSSRHNNRNIMKKNSDEKNDDFDLGDIDDLISDNEN